MHVVFDLDGVLLDSESDLAWLDRALEDTLVAFDIEPTEEHRAMLYPANIPEFEATAEEFGVPVEELWETRNGYYLEEKIGAIRSGEIGPFPDVEVLHDLAAEYPLSIISNSPREVIEAFVVEAGLEAIIDEQIGRRNDLQGLVELKPDPHFYHQLDDRSDADAYVYVGDTEDDERFAERTGMDYIHLDREDGEVQTLYQVADRIRDLA